MSSSQWGSRSRDAGKPDKKGSGYGNTAKRIPNSRIEKMLARVPGSTVAQIMRSLDADDLSPADRKKLERQVSAIKNKRDQGGKDGKKK